LVLDDDSDLHYQPLVKLVRDICFSFQDVCRSTKKIVFNEVRGELYFEDLRTEAAFKNQMFAIKDFLVFHLREDLMKMFKVPARMLAAGLLALYDAMALEYEARKEPLSSKRIASKNAGKVPVLLLNRKDNRQYFFVPDRYNPTYFNNDRETWVMVERTYPVKLFTHQNASNKTPHQLATSARFDILKA
jgi:hypothetical protein